MSGLGIKDTGAPTTDSYFRDECYDYENVKDQDDDKNTTWHPTLSPVRTVSFIKPLKPSKLYRMNVSKRKPMMTVGDMMT